MLDVVCEVCQRKYKVDERRVAPSGLKMRCPSCGYSFIVTKPLASAEVEPVVSRDPLADSIIERVVGAYASARLYSDRGALTLELSPVQLRLKAKFETSFERPYRFSFSVSATTNYDQYYAHRIAMEGDHLQVGDPEWRSGRPESLGSAP